MKNVQQINNGQQKFQPRLAAHKSDIVAFRKTPGAQSLLVEQARYLHKNIPAAVLGMLLNTVCVNTLTFWRSTTPALMSLLAFITVACGFRLHLWYRHTIDPIDYHNGLDFIRQNAAFTAFPSIAAGLYTWVVLPTASPSQQIICIGTILFHCVASAFNLSVHYRSFIYTALPLSTAALLAVLLRHTYFDTVFALAFLAFFIAVYWFAYRFHLFFIESIYLRFKNLELVEQLTTQKEAAESASLAKSRFLASASHDLRQPMHALSLYLDSMVSDSFPPALRGILEKAIQCTRSMNSMFRALLDISRLDAQVVQPQECTFMLSEILENLRVQFEPDAHAKHLRLRVRSCSVLVKGDPAMLERILGNLISNALRYTKQGGVLIGCRLRKDIVRVSIYDTGLGIPAHLHRTIFQEFYQASHDDPSSTKGLGLGLAIVDRLAKLTKTSITLASTPEKGSVFSVDIPRALPQTETATSKELLIQGADNLNGRTVILVEDDHAVLDATALLLRKWDCRVITAKSYEAARKLAVACNTPPQLIICDYQLNDNTTGIDVIHMIRDEFNEDIPALLVTGNTIRERIQELEAEDFPVLHKPIEPELLHNTLIALLRIH